jgi:hypothetical protein
MIDEEKHKRRRVIFRAAEFARAHCPPTPSRTAMEIDAHFSKHMQLKGMKQIPP